MARAIWSGSVSFGLVNVPVKAYTAVRDHEVHFHQLERKSGARIRYEKVSEKTGKEVPSGDIELGYELPRGTYVIVDPDELDELRPTSTRSIAVADFVDLADIDPVYYERTYWLAPDGESAERAYRLLFAAMDQSDRAGIGTVVMRNKQYLAAIRPYDGALAMSTMRFADEVVPRSAIDQIPRGKPGADTKELRLATQIIDSLTTDWDPTRYRDTYTDELKDLLGRKAKGEEIVAEAAPAARADVVDLLAALESSVAEAKRARGAKPAHAGRAHKTPPAASGAPAHAAAKRARAGATRRTDQGAKRAVTKTAASRPAKKPASRRSA